MNNNQQLYSTLFIQTYGCQMNEYDSNRIVDLLSQHYKVIQVNTPEEADILLLNTCSVREKAQEKVFSELGRWRKLKSKKPNSIIGVGGCVASQEGNEILKRAPYVDVIFGPQTLHRLPELISQRLKKGKAAVDITFPEVEKFDKLPEPSVNGASAYVSIQEGCSKYCTYCIVPFTRGPEVNRPFDDILKEVISLTEKGVKEITLLGQNVNAYRYELEDSIMADLALLIKYIAEIDGVERIRFTTSHPVEFSDSLIEAYASVPQLANHLHLPVQSGSDRVLSLMKRGHTALEYKSKIRRLRAIRPNISISSDFIVGYPEETEEDFNQTLELVDAIGFDHSYSFIYSKRPGTPAAYYEDMIPLEEKKRRLSLLQHRIRQSAMDISNAMLHSEQKVLVSGFSKKYPHLLTSKSENNRVVLFKGDKSLIGNIVKVKISEVHPHHLNAELS